VSKRLLLWVGPAAAAAALEHVVRTEGGDTWMFVNAGRVLLSANWSHAFADQGTQVGPLQLALYGSAGRWPGALAMLLAATAALLVMAAARAAGVEYPRLLALAGIAAVATGLTTHVFDAGHPANGLLPLLWIAAAVEARRGRALRAALVVGLSAGFETWGILGLAVLALAPSLRSAARAALVAGCIAALLYLPFVASGHFAMERYDWQIASDSLLGHVFAAGTAFGWPLRLAQGAAVLVIGVIAARLGRGSVHAVWFVPMSIVLARLALDPQEHGYYFDGVQATALVALTLVAARGRFARVAPPSRPATPRRSRCTTPSRAVPHRGRACASGRSPRTQQAEPRALRGRARSARPF
jgi:hypothetical protein